MLMSKRFQLFKEDVQLKAAQAKAAGRNGKAVFASPNVYDLRINDYRGFVDSGVKPRPIAALSRRYKKAHTSVLSFLTRK